MPIVIKEVVVKTTVERMNTPTLESNEDLIETIKQQIIDELRIEQILKRDNVNGREKRRR